MAVTNFIWDPLSKNVLLETDENDDAVVEYTYQPGLFGELLSQDRGGVTSSYHFDGKHSTRQITDDDQNVTDTSTYSAFGDVVAKTGVTTNAYGYKGGVGYYTNPKTDDLYVRARTYEPTTGRWLSKDPIGFSDGVNLYRAYFVPNSVDPSGKCVACKTGDCRITDWNYSDVGARFVLRVGADVFDIDVTDPPPNEDWEDFADSVAGAGRKFLKVIRKKGAKNARFIVTRLVPTKNLANLLFDVGEIYWQHDVWYRYHYCENGIWKVPWWRVNIYGHQTILSSTAYHLGDITDPVDRKHIIKRSIALLNDAAANFQAWNHYLTTKRDIQTHLYANYSHRCKRITSMVK